MYNVRVCPSAANYIFVSDKSVFNASENGKKKMKNACVENKIKCFRKAMAKKELTTIG